MSENGKPTGDPAANAQPAPGEAPLAPAAVAPLLGTGMDSPVVPTSPPADDGEIAPAPGVLHPYDQPRGPLQALDALTAKVFAWLGQDSIPRMAAALAYRTIFSIIPIMVLAFVMMRLLADSETRLKELLSKALHQTGLSDISAGQQSVEAWMTGIVSNFNSINFGAIGIVSAATLIYAAISLLVDIESSFNYIYNAPRGRSWPRRLLQYWMMVSLGPFMVYASFYVGDLLTTQAIGAAGVGGETLAPYLIVIAKYVSTVTISATLLLVLYITVPNTSVRFLPAVGGAFTAGLLLELAKLGFQKFVRPENYNALYSSLALLPLFLLWVYITWFIVLFGLRVSFLMQHGKHGLLLAAIRGGGVGGSGLGGSWIEPARSVTVATAVAEAFAKGRPARLERLADTAGLDETTTRLLLRRLEQAGLVHRVATDSREAGYALSRPPDAILVCDVVAVGQELSGPIGPGAGGALIARIRAAQLAAVEGVTLASLASTRTPRPAPKPTSEAQAAILEPVAPRLTAPGASHP